MYNTLIKHCRHDWCACKSIQVSHWVQLILGNCGAIICDIMIMTLHCSCTVWFSFSLVFSMLQFYLCLIIPWEVLLSRIQEKHSSCRLLFPLNLWTLHETFYVVFLSYILTYSNTFLRHLNINSYLFSSYQDTMEFFPISPKWLSGKKSVEF